MKPSNVPQPLGKSNQISNWEAIKIHLRPRFNFCQFKVEFSDEDAGLNRSICNLPRQIEKRPSSVASLNVKKAINRGQRRDLQRVSKNLSHNIKVKSSSDAIKNLLFDLCSSRNETVSFIVTFFYSEKFAFALTSGGGWGCVSSVIK